MAIGLTEEPDGFRVGSQPMERRITTRSEQHHRGMFFSEVMAKLDLAISKAVKDTPTVGKGSDGGKIEIFHRFGAPETSRWIKLPDGQLAPVRSSDIVHHRDRDGNLIERKRVKKSPKEIQVFPEGKSVFP